MRIASIGTIAAVCLLAASSANACPADKTFLAIDKALWENAKESGQPYRWIQYFVSQGCPDNKKAAQNLLAPLFGIPGTSESTALSKIKYFGKFSGDQTGTEEQATNGQQLKSNQGGGHLYTFKLSSKVMSEGIPRSLYKGIDPPTKETANVALWIEYRCAVVGQVYSSDFLGVPGKSEGGICPHGGGAGIFDRINLKMQGPFAQFFTLDCRKQNGHKCEQEGHWISIATITLAPKPEFANFMQLLTQSYVK